VKVATLFASLVILAFLSGCAATQQIVWSKPGVTAAQGEKDLEDCANKANMVYPSSENMINPNTPADGKLETGYIIDSDVLKDNFSKCMGAKGYKFAGSQPIAAAGR